MRRLFKEPAEQSAAALVLLFRSVTLSFLVLPLHTILFQLIVIEQHIPLKRIVRQIEQVVVKHGSLHCRLASIHHIEPNAHLMPRAALGGNLLHTGLKYVLVAVIHHQGQWADLVSRNVAKFGLAILDRNCLGVMRIIALGTQRQFIARFKIT